MKSEKVYLAGKRAADILLSSAAAIVLFPPMVIIAAMIRIDSPGANPIFSQKRVGFRGKEFLMYKYRTMIPHAEEMLDQLISSNEMHEPVFKMTADPRVTRLGHFLRRTSLDELPQLWNVIRGEMSLVGPRPALPREVEQYSDYQKKRLSVKPGMTCYWQVQPGRNRCSFDDWVEMDLKYIRERSFRTDFLILLKTVKAVLRMDGI